MIRHLNKTGRVRITREHIDISIREGQPKEIPIFDMELDLSRYRFPSEARVRLEASRSNVGQRWEYGTVGALTQPSEEERRLTDVPETVQFRLVVVAGDGTGKLLGHADKIKPLLPRGSLLPLRETDELQNEVWRVDFGEDDLPELLVNRRIEGISEIVRTDVAFRSLIMPDVLRSVLMRILVIEPVDFDDDELPEWQKEWLDLARRHLPGERLPRAREEAAEIPHWIDQVVNRFAGHPVDAMRRYRDALNGRI